MIARRCCRHRRRRIRPRQRRIFNFPLTLHIYEIISYIRYRCFVYTLC